MTCCMPPSADPRWHGLLTAAPAGVNQTIAAVSGTTRHSQRSESDLCLRNLFTISSPFQSRRFVVGLMVWRHFPRRSDALGVLGQQDATDAIPIVQAAPCAGGAQPIAVNSAIMQAAHGPFQFS